jgi:hypothetical protein
MKMDAEFTFCSIDDKPIDQSIAYKLLLLNGKKVANCFTYTVTVPLIDRKEELHDRNH